MQLPGKTINLWLRDIFQAYTQSIIKLNRIIFARLPQEIRHRYPDRTIIIIVKSLYGIAETGTY
jgi:hypothetical protein